MAIRTVRVKINGTWTNLTYNSSTGKYEGTVTAPSTTSFNLSGGYYPVVVEATNDAGTVITKDDTDSILGNSLKLKVKETVKPVITLTSPTNGSYIQNNKPTITFKIVDESGGSGVKSDSIKLKIDGSNVSFTKTSITNGYQCSYTPSSVLSDGSHTISISAQDNDGNIATSVSSAFTVDTIPPTLSITEPTATITNQPSCTVKGVTNDATSSPVTVKITLNSGSAETVSVDSSGNFTKTLTLAEGENTIKVVATDAAGRSTTVTKTINLDTTIPQIVNVKFNPNPVNTSQPVKITLEVS